MKKRIKELLNKYRCNFIVDIFKQSRNIFFRILSFFDKAIVFNWKKLWFLSQRSHLVNRYLMTYKIHKLQLGGGANIFDGWLNTDFMPKHKGIVILDVTKPFFLKNDTFDYIFCEHVIEHIGYQDGLQMLEECFRILKPGGKIRISTPDLDVYVRLFTPQKSKIQEQHINWISDNWLKRQGIDSHGESFVLNLMMHGWGHKFIYDFKTLENAMEEAGFVGIVKVAAKQSNDSNFKNIEQHGDYIKNIKGINRQYGSVVDNQMNEFGSLTVEAVKK